MGEENLRENWIDELKGLAIILVLLGHSFTRGNYSYGGIVVNSIIYAFHMPLFFILSGIVLNINIPYGTYLKKKKRLIVAYVAFICLYYVFSKVVLKNDIDINIQEHFYDTVWCTSNSVFSMYWFFLTLFVALVIAYWVLKIKNVVIELLITIVIGVLFVYLVPVPLYSIRESLIALPYICVGYHLSHNEYLNTQLECQSRIKGILAGIVLLGIIGIFFYVIYVKYGLIIISYYASVLHSVPLAYALGLSCSVLLIFVFKSIKTKPYNTLGWIGKKSLLFYGLHYLYLETYEKYVAYKLGNQWYKVFAFVLLFTVTTVLLLDMCVHYRITEQNKGKQRV